MNKKIIIILALALVVRLIAINQSFWLDEATTATVARNMSLSEYLTNFAPKDFHPPLYYLVVKIWTTLFGYTELALRSLSVIAGVASVYLLFLIGKELFNKNTGSLASLLLATSGLHIYFSQEARMYVLASLFVTLSVYFFVKTQKGTGVGNWLGYSLAVAAMVMTHYLTVFIIPVYWLAGVVSKKPKNWWKKFIASHNILILVGLAWLPTFLLQFGAGTRVSSTAPLWWNILGKTSIKEILLVPAKFLLGRISSDNNYFYAATLLFVGLIMAIPFINAIKRYRKAKLVLGWFFVPFLLTATLGLFLPVFSYFRLLFLLPAFYLIIGYGITEQKRYQRSLLVVILAINIVSSGIYLIFPKFQREDWRGAATFINGSKVAESVVMFPANSQQEAYRFYSVSDKILGPEDPVEKVEEIWLMRYVQSIFDPDDKVLTKIQEQGFDKVSEHDFNGVVVWLYQKNQ